MILKVCMCKSNSLACGQVPLSEICVNTLKFEFIHMNGALVRFLRSWLEAAKSRLSASQFLGKCLSPLFQDEQITNLAFNYKVALLLFSCFCLKDLH